MIVILWYTIELTISKFYNSACGRFNLLPGLEDDAKALKGKRKSKNNEWPPIKILYPTQNMALNNRGSISLGGNFFMEWVCYIPITNLINCI